MFPTALGPLQISMGQKAAPTWQALLLGNGKAFKAEASTRTAMNQLSQTELSKKEFLPRQA
jgi:hypothetical protein